MVGHAFPGVISHGAAVVAPALTVMAIILFMGKISGAHLNPAVSIAFALRRTFGPDLVGTTLTGYWVRIAGPVAGTVIAVGIAFALPRAACSPRPTSPATPENPAMATGSGA